jgi:predicted RNase H-like HicB family nuclease
MVLIYCQEEALDRIEQAIGLVKKKYDHEGIGYFVL